MANALIDVSNNLADAVEHAGRSVVSIAEGGQHGVSGTVWREGVVVAADHTIRGREEVTVLLPNGATTEGRIAGRDPGCDIAVVKLRDHGVPNAKHADSPQPRVGHIVLAVGRRAEAGLNASYGVISALGGPWRTWQGGRVDRYFRLDLLPFTGFSGGPLIDAQGGVLGINTSGPRRSILTIPLSTVDRVVTQLLEKGRALYAGVRAVLPRDTSGPEIIAAVEAAAAGLTVLSNDELDVLLPSSVDAAAVDALAGEPLTAREMEILAMLAEGVANKEIAARLNITEHTVKFHVSSILSKLGVTSRGEAVARGLREGLIVI